MRYRVSSRVIERGVDQAHLYSLEEGTNVPFKYEIRELTIRRDVWRRKGRRRTHRTWA